jgi:hypothetical protein
MSLPAAVLRLSPLTSLGERLLASLLHLAAAVEVRLRRVRREQWLLAALVAFLVLFVLVLAFQPRAGGGGR